MGQLSLLPETRKRHAAKNAGARMLIYKITPSALWARALEDGVFQGAPIDLADGYIHFSAAHQVRETAAKWFAGAADLVLVAVEAEKLGEALRWEQSRGGDMFPHLYAPLDVAAVAWSKPLPLRDSVHDFAGLLA